MRSWRSGDDLIAPCSSRLLHALMKEGPRVVCGAFIVAALAAAQSSKPLTQKAVVHKANELTLAGLRPGRDRLSQAARLFQNIDSKSSMTDSQAIWKDPCRKQVLAADFDIDKKIQVIRVGTVPLTADCLPLPPSPWKTGLGLRVGDSAAHVTRLYGEPDSKSPSTRDGQPLELWYYAFDWAGPEVPQVMEVLCTRKKEGQPGRVVEITLAAPSL